MLKIILDYDWCVLYDTEKGKYYVKDENDIFEVELVACLTYDVNDDCYADICFLSSMFDNDYCGERVLDDRIEFLWFKEIK
jgi:hypothetical protein